MKRKIYVDFDGVIWDTWPMLYKTLEENDKILYDKMINKTLTPEEDLAIGKVFIKCNNWDLIMENTFPIDGSVEALKNLFDQKLFDISILTHCNTDSEVLNKQKIIDKYFYGMEMIPVFKPMAKSEAVDAKGAILIDDYSGNLEEWENAGGIGVKFSLTECNTRFYCIASLLDIVSIVEELEHSNNVVEGELDLAEAAA